MRLTPECRPTGDEQDVYTGWRRVISSYRRAGAVKKVKKRTHRLDRRVREKAEIAAQMRDA